MRFKCLSAICLCMCLIVVIAKDLYEILEIERSATARDIRRAYKRLALLKHPDKNPHDESAHVKFLEITRSYEVLKDPDLRRKYDTYGEEALKDEQSGGRQYESWNFYNTEFGIYDDDTEIVTLSTSDFEELLESTGDIWFVNFYSPRCSHCHDLAPVWRSIARELDGVLRIGAVNCGDEWHLCRMQGVHAYPTLIMYPNRNHFESNRNEQNILKFAMKYVTNEVMELTSVPEEILKNSPFLITFCSLDGDCLSKNTRLKVSSMLSGITKVAYVDCDKNEKLCSNFGIDHGTIFFKNGVKIPNEGLHINSLEAKDVSNIILATVEDLRTLSDDYVYHVRKVKQPWLLLLTGSTEDVDIQFKKLPALLQSHSIRVGRVICANSKICSEFYVFKTPSFVLLKSNGGYEINFGRQSALDVSAWAKSAYDSPLVTLNAENFHTKIATSSKPWLVDFFAPWVHIH